MICQDGYHCDIKNVNNHEKIKDNAWYVEDSSGRRAIIELHKIYEVEYDPLIHNIYTFDRIYEYAKLDYKILFECCIDKPITFEKYLKCMPAEEYNKIKSWYINNYLKYNSKYSVLADVFLKTDYERGNLEHDL